MLGFLRRLATPVVAVACLALASTSRAESILVDSGSPVITGSGPYTWSYGVSVTTSATVQKSDFFVIVDFAGLVAGSITTPSLEWVATTEATTGPITGLSGTVTPASDSASIPNIRFTYVGAPTIAPGSSLGTFTAKSVYNVIAAGVLVAQDHNYNPGVPVLHDKIDVNSQTVGVPVAVPLPAIAPMGAMLFSGLGGMKLRRRRATA